MTKITDRRAVLGGLVILGGGAAFVAAGGRNLFYDAITEAVAGEVLSPAEAHQKAVAGDITLLDIRRPDEWAKTGSGEGAVRLDMRRDDFVTALEALVDGKRDAPVALICARGVRSARLNNRLVEAGFTNIIDVPEGMLGSSAGPGWIKRDLPLVKDK
jgi:rhodanese-related sulfurtransferase